jgi:DNA-binding response OmpR family regulator
MNQKKILVIDDELAICYLLERQLRRAGFTVCAIPDGSEGLAVLSTFVPDLVILDIMMPDMDGFEVCRRIRKHLQAADTPIMFLSGSTTKEHKRLAFELGADDFLVKPFRKEELLAHIETLFGRCGQTGRQYGERTGEHERPAAYWRAGMATN